MPDMSYLSMERLLEEQRKREQAAKEKSGSSEEVHVCEHGYPRPARNCAVAWCRWRHGNDHAFREAESSEKHWMTPEEIQRYKELIAEQHHLAIAAILKDRGPVVDKDGDYNEFAVFHQAEFENRPKRCIHGGKFGCYECQLMRLEVSDVKETLKRLEGAPEPPRSV